MKHIKTYNWDLKKVTVAQLLIEIREEKDALEEENDDLRSINENLRRILEINHAKLQNFQSKD